MLQVGPKHWLVEDLSELPEPRSAPLYLDYETRSHDDSLRTKAIWPYKGDRIAMAGVTWEDSDRAWAIPVRMRDGRCNVPVDAFRRWNNAIFAKAPTWRNHNPKFDWHFAAEDEIEVPFDTRVECTLTMAKIIDSDRWSHGLKDLCREWLGYDYQSEDKVDQWLSSYRLPRGAKARCYGLVPTDLMAHYNCDDVLANRSLYRDLDERMDDQLRPTWDMERLLTCALFDMERAGLRTDEQTLKIEKLKSMRKQIMLATRVHELTSREFVDSAKFSYGLLIGDWGLPILARNKKSGNPTFDADALKLYLSHPEVVHDPMKSEVLKAVVALREEETYMSLFVDSFLEMRDSRGYVHTDYNQLVRTGRMSAKRPNSQQWDDRAKELIFTDRPTGAFIYHDASQLEFRFIVHYIKDEEAIAAYQQDPKTDFHDWSSKMCHMDRPEGKTMNFAVSFGAGMQTTVAQLAASERVIKEVTAEIDVMIGAGKIGEGDRLEMFKELCFARGKDIYKAYHDRFPGIKAKSKKAMRVCKARGFVFNLYGRRRHLPGKAAHVAFNTLCQGGAADYVKRRIIKTAPRYNPEMRRDGLTQRASVHDSILHHHDDIEATMKWAPMIREMLEVSDKDHPLIVPIIWDPEIHRARWKHA